jgi:hypothetical protein
MLRVDADDRATSAEVLQHPWLGPENQLACEAPGEYVMEGEEGMVNLWDNVDISVQPSVTELASENPDADLGTLPQYFHSCLSQHAQSVCCAVCIWVTCSKLHLELCCVWPLFVALHSVASVLSKCAVVNCAWTILLLQRCLGA